MALVVLPWRSTQCKLHLSLRNTIKFLGFHFSTVCRTKVCCRGESFHSKTKFRQLEAKWITIFVFLDCICWHFISMKSFVENVSLYVKVVWIRKQNKSDYLWRLLRCQEWEYLTLSNKSFGFPNFAFASFLIIQCNAITVTCLSIHTSCCL